VLEQRDRGYAEARVRAGVLEHGAAELLRAAGVGGRMDREALVHRGIYLNFDGSRHHIDFHALVGRTILVYGQQEVVIDLIQARLDAGGDIRFEAEAIGIDAAMPAVRYVSEGQERVLEAELVAACDGSHGVGRAALERSTVYDHEFEHAWLGVLARTPPASDELIYAYHDHGFALHSMRSPEISRLYLQVAPDEQLESWPEERIWAELRIRLGEPNLRAGEILELGVTPMRSVVVEPMQGGRLFLAGDAAHIVLPPGRRGLNLALGDAAVLARAIVEWFRTSADAALKGYSDECAQRVWRAQRFSWFMTNLLHKDRVGDPFQHRLRLANLGHIVSSTAASASLAENYVGAATDGVELDPALRA